MTLRLPCLRQTCSPRKQLHLKDNMSTEQGESCWHSAVLKEEEASICKAPILLHTVLFPPDIIADKAGGCNWKFLSANTLAPA
eukprot:747613-Hanusia_phi.AAC.1